MEQYLLEVVALEIELFQNDVWNGSRFEVQVGVANRRNVNEVFQNRLSIIILSQI